MTISAAQRIFSLSLFITWLLSCTAAESQTVAFPGAFGLGASATGGRGGTVYHVTNLNDSGTGSFRDAVSAGNRTVVFDVGGYIVLQSPVSVSSNLTIAGQTAPGGGIGIMAGEVSLSAQTNIIMRNVRIRQGNQDPLTGKSALNMGTAHNIILDHCSFEYGQFDSVDAVGTVDFTVQNSIIADPIGQQFGAHVEVGPSTFYRNLWVNAHNRQPLSKDNTQYINNIIYGYQSAYTVADTGGLFSHDLVNNYFIAGPETTSAGDAYFQVNSNQSIYAVGNFIDGNQNGVLDGTASNTVGSAKVLTAPWAATTSSIPTLSAAAAFTSLLASSGAIPRDSVDTFVLGDVASLGTKGQLYKDQSLTGLANDGYGVLAAGTPFANSSGDGIADYWASANGISTTDPEAGNAMYGTTGYNNLEVYINSLVLPSPWTASDLPGTPVQGATSYNVFTDQWLLTGSGMNASSTINQGQFSSQPMISDGTLMAKLSSLSGAGSRAQSGIMLRSVSNNGTSFVALVGTGSGGLSFLTFDAGTSKSHAVQLRSAPAHVWMKIVQSAETFAASYSSDGVNWTLLGTESLDFTAPVSAGLVFSSGSESSLGTSSFSNVSLTN
jgi:regulation of enolase protein 1 (concanavalin A-like superfamily)